MTRTFFLLLFVGLSITATAQDRYRVDIDLEHIKNDRLRVYMWPPAVNADTATFVFPVTVPGTYEEHFWWRMVENFQAYDASNRLLPVTRSVDSQFVVHGARDLRYVAYEVEDTFDDTTDRVDVFLPAGTCWGADSIAVLNHGGLVPYIDGMQKMPFKVSVHKPSYQWGGSALPIDRISSTLDVYEARSYDQLVDNPVLYALPDTARFNVEGVDVLVHCAHDGTDTIAGAYARELVRNTKTIARFLPSMPVERYAFLFYLWKGNKEKVAKPHAMGALEHNQSSFYFLGFQKRPLGLGEISIHEFLHILVPLNVHSQEIDAFNFRFPKMSQHLWLYEGTTEYFSTLAPLHDSTINEQAFAKQIVAKLRDDEDIPEKFSLTEFSKNVLTEEFRDIYDKVYTYGAVNAFLLDIVIRDASGGKQGLRDVVWSLMQDFGPNKPFNDDELFDHIERRTSKAVRLYLDTYVRGTARIPVADVVAKIGWTYTAERTKKEPGFGCKPDFDMKDGKPTIVLHTTSADNPLGIADGDILMRVDSIDTQQLFSSDEGRKLLMKFRRPKLGDELTFTVDRNGKELNLTGKAVMVDVIERHFLEVNPKPTPEQTALKNSLYYK